MTKEGIMSKHIFYIFLIGFTLVTGCVTTPTDDIKINAEADKKINFSGYNSYQWVGAAGILKDPEGKWKQPNFDIDKEIRFLIDREFRKLGMTETSRNPDMIVAYVLGVNMAALKLKENPETKLPIIKNIPKGALLIVIVDPKTRYVMWIGQASAQVQQNPDMKIVKARLDYAVTQMIKKIPR